METSAAAEVSRDRDPLSLPGVIDPRPDFVVGLVLAISSGIQTDRQTDRQTQTDSLRTSSRKRHLDRPALSPKVTSSRAVAIQ